MLAHPAPVEELAAVWKALADPTRREILDRLRDGAQTTGQLAEAFPDVTRFAVMKHLKVLVEAGLVLIRREGRERWNHLNPMPIQQIARRWIRPFEAEAAERLLRLKTVAEGMPEEEQVKSEDDRQFRTIDIQLELGIGAPPARVWRALTAEIALWWPAKFYVGPAPVRFTLEPFVGGRVFEDWGDGEGALWGTVSAVRVNELLQWVADIPIEYGGPARGITSFRLEPQGKGTRLQFRDTQFGERGVEVGDQLRTGWKFLLEDCLSPFVEKGIRPERPESVIAHEDENHNDKEGRKKR